MPKYSKKKLNKISRILGSQKLRPVNCNLCDHNDYREILEEAGFHVVKCNMCGFVYTNPIPTEVYLSDSEEELHKDVQEANQKKIVFRSMLRHLKQFKKTGRLLDVGCGLGYFIQMANEAGYHSTGIDLNCKRVDFLKKSTNFDIRYGILEKVEFKNGSFDIITLLETLEHVSDPTGLILECNRILEKNGILVIEVPNLTFQLTKARFFKMISRRTGSQYYGVLPFMHLVHFNTRTLTQLLTKCGFQPLKFTPRGLFFSPDDPMIMKSFRLLHHYIAMFIRASMNLNIDSALVAYARKTEPNT